MPSRGACPRAEAIKEGNWHQKRHFELSFEMPNTRCPSLKLFPEQHSQMGLHIGNYRRRTWSDPNSWQPALQEGDILVGQIRNCWSGMKASKDDSRPPSKKSSEQ